MSKVSEMQTMISGGTLKQKWVKSNSFPLKPDPLMAYLCWGNLTLPMLRLLMSKAQGC